MTYTEVNINTDNLPSQEGSTLNPSLSSKSQSCLGHCWSRIDRCKTHLANDINSMIGCVFMIMGFGCGTPISYWLISDSVQSHKSEMLVVSCIISGIFASMGIAGVILTIPPCRNSLLQNKWYDCIS